MTQTNTLRKFFGRTREELCIELLFGEKDNEFSIRVAELHFLRRTNSTLYTIHYNRCGRINNMLKIYLARIITNPDVFAKILRETCCFVRVYDK